MIQITRPSLTPGDGGSGAREENLLVTVRIRPLIAKELALNDFIAWESPDGQTIVCKDPNHKQPPTPITFDRVFDADCSSQKVYEEGVKNVAMSALKGINATVFAYGETSSGKTFTMRGITENVVNDIYEHIKKTPQREFKLTMSAFEIYDETVIDLLSRYSSPLKLIDHPEKGTIVEQLVEEVVRDSQHLIQLIGICEAQRQLGETFPNNKSSRSHQIIQLTVESSLRKHSGVARSCVASLNLVDLAGSERASSRANEDCTRLKESCHNLNLSLLTLTTVIRKLSYGNNGKSGHIPYRDSKLTRILQHSLGGNARTAFICTITPVSSHMEQTRNSLCFAVRAKEVTNKPQVNTYNNEKTLNFIHSGAAQVYLESFVDDNLRLGEWLLLFINIILEITSTIFEQFNNAFVGMILAFLGLFLCIGEVIYKARREKVRWVQNGFFSWFYSHYPHYKLFGTTIEYFQLAVAVWQCLHFALGYVFARMNKQNPVNTSVPMLLLCVCLLVSNIIKKYSVLPRLHSHSA